MIKVEEIVEKYKGYEVDEEKLKEFLIPPKPKTVWDLKIGDRYWFLDSYGTVRDCVLGNGVIDNGRRAIGNCFLTREEAQVEVERRKIEAIMLKYGRREFKYDENNVCMFYKHEEQEVAIANESIYQNQGTIYFDKYDLCKQAIEEAGEDNIKKYIFGVDSK